MPDESTEVIEQKMSDTRDSLTQKVSALENQVVDTLQSASTTVSNMVDQVKTVVPETISGMKVSITGVSDHLKASLDVSKHTRERPWAMVGGAAALGFISGMILFRRSYPPRYAQSAPVMSPPASSAPRAASAPVKLPGWLDEIVDRLAGRVSEEVRKLGEVAVATASASLQQSVERVLPTLLGSAMPDTASSNRVNAGERNGFAAVRDLV